MTTARTQLAERFELILKEFEITSTDLPKDELKQTVKEFMEKVNALEIENQELSLSHGLSKNSGRLAKQISKYKQSLSLFQNSIEADIDPKNTLKNIR